MLTAGSAAWAQTYSTNPRTQGTSQGTSQGSYGENQGSYSTGNPGDQSYQGTSGNQGSWNSGASQGGWNGGGANQGNWNTGMQGSSTPYSGQTYSHAGYGTGNISTYQEAEQQLGKYGYSNIQDLRPTEGWSADAMRNGQRVHVILSDNGLVATFPGR